MPSRAIELQTPHSPSIRCCHSAVACWSAHRGRSLCQRCVTSCQLLQPGDMRYLVGIMGLPTIPAGAQGLQVNRHQCNIHSMAGQGYPVDPGSDHTGEGSTQGQRGQPEADSGAGLSSPAPPPPAPSWPGRCMQAGQAVRISSTLQLRECPYGPETEMWSQA